MKLLQELDNNYRCVGIDKYNKLKKTLSKAFENKESADITDMVFDKMSGVLIDDYQRQGLNIVSSDRNDVNVRYSYSKLLESNKKKILDKKAYEDNIMIPNLKDINGLSVKEVMSRLYKQADSYNGTIMLELPEGGYTTDCAYTFLLLAFDTRHTYDVSHVINSLEKVLTLNGPEKQKIDTKRKYKVIMSGGELLDIYFNSKEGMWLDSFGRFYSNSTYSFIDKVLPIEFGVVSCKELIETDKDNPILEIVSNIIRYLEGSDTTVDGHAEEVKSGYTFSDILGID